MAEKMTIARPYAEAIFDYAAGQNILDEWSNYLQMLSLVCADKSIKALIGSPEQDRQALKGLINEVSGGDCSQAFKNTVSTLVDYQRLYVITEICHLFEEKKAKHQGFLNVEVISAFKLNKAQEKRIADALKLRFGCEIVISAIRSTRLLGGIIIRVGDVVIDGSVRCSLEKLATQLQI